MIKNWLRLRACAFTQGVYFTLVYLLKPPRQEFTQSLSQDGGFLLTLGLTCPSTEQTPRSPSACLQNLISLLLAPFKLGLASWKEKKRKKRQHRDASMLSMSHP